MLTHTGEKPFLYVNAVALKLVSYSNHVFHFRCMPCNKTFSRKHQLEQHMGTMTHQQTVRALQSNDTTRHSEIY